MGLDDDFWLDTPGLSESMRIFRDATFKTRAWTKVSGLTIDQLRAATNKLWEAYRQLEKSPSTDHKQAAGYTLLALHELYRQEYVPFTRSGRVGGIEHFQEGLKPLDALESLLPKLFGLQSFKGQFLAHRLEWLAQPQQFGMEPDGWETQYDAERRECETQLQSLPSQMISPIKVANVFLGNRHWEQAIEFCRAECLKGFSDATRAEAHTMIGVRISSEWADAAAGQQMWAKAGELIAGMPYSARVPHANAYGLTEALAGIHDQFPGKTADQDGSLHFAEWTEEELSSLSPQQQSVVLESYGPLAQYWVGYVHDVLTPAKEKNTIIFFKACRGYYRYIALMSSHGNRWDHRFIARVFSFVHLPKQHGFLDVPDELHTRVIQQFDALYQLNKARPLETDERSLQSDEPKFRRFSFLWSRLKDFVSQNADLDQLDCNDPVLAARQQRLFESVLTTAAAAQASISHHSTPSSSVPQSLVTPHHPSSQQATAINSLLVRPIHEIDLDDPVLAVRRLRLSVSALQTTDTAAAQTRVWIPDESVSSSSVVSPSDSNEDLFQSETADSAEGWSQARAATVTTATTAPTSQSQPASLQHSISSSPTEEVRENSTRVGSVALQSAMMTAAADTPCGGSSSAPPTAAREFIDPLQTDQKILNEVGRRRKKIEDDDVLKDFYLGFQREMTSRFQGSGSISSGMAAPNVGSLSLTIVWIAISFIPVFGAIVSKALETVTSEYLAEQWIRYANNVCKIAINSAQIDALVQNTALEVLDQPGMSERLKQLNEDEETNISLFERLTRFISKAIHKTQVLFKAFAEKHEGDFQAMGGLEAIRLLSVVGNGDARIFKDDQGKTIAFSKLKPNEQVERLQRVVCKQLIPTQGTSPEAPSSAGADVIQPATTSTSPAVSPAVSSSSVSTPACSGSVSSSAKSAANWKFHTKAMSETFGTKKIVTWQFVWRQHIHTVELRHSPWGNRKVIVNGDLRVDKHGSGETEYVLGVSVGEGLPTFSIGVQIKSSGKYGLSICELPFLEALQHWLKHTDV